MSQASAPLQDNMPGETDELEMDLEQEPTVGADNSKNPLVLPAESSDEEHPQFHAPPRINLNDKAPSVDDGEAQAELGNENDIDNELDELESNSGAVPAAGSGKKNGAKGAAGTGATSGRPQRKRKAPVGKVPIGGDVAEKNG